MRSRNNTRSFRRIVHPEVLCCRGLVLEDRHLRLQPVDAVFHRPERLGPMAREDDHEDDILAILDDACAVEELDGIDTSTILQVGLDRTQPLGGDRIVPLECQLEGRWIGLIVMSPDPSGERGGRSPGGDHGRPNRGAVERC